MARYQKLFRNGDIELGEMGGGRVCSWNVHQLSSLGWTGLKGYVQDCSELRDKENKRSHHPPDNIRNGWPDLGVQGGERSCYEHDECFVMRTHGMGLRAFVETDLCDTVSVE